MTYLVTIKVMLHKGLLDPQGKATEDVLIKLGHNNIENIRVGKNIELNIEAPNEAEAKALATVAAEKLLANPVMEYFEVVVN